jgi:hypothetical protein
VYGTPFKSDRQRGWFFASLKDGSLEIPYTRSHNLSDGWEVIGSGEKAILVNESPYAKYAYGDSTQNMLLAAIGWRKLSKMLKDNKGMIVQKARAAVRKALRKR